MDKLENNIKTYFKNSTENKPDMEMWNNISKELGKTERKNKFILLWWLFPISAIAIGGFFLFLNSINHSYQNHGIISIKKDTVYVEKIIIKYDTIFKEKIVYSNWSKPTKEQYLTNLELKDYPEFENEKSFENSPPIKSLDIGSNKITRKNGIADGIKDGVFADTSYKVKFVYDKTDAKLIDEEALPYNDSNNETFRVTKLSQNVKLDQRQILNISPLDIKTLFVSFNNKIMIVNTHHLVSIKKKNRISVGELLRPKAIYLGIGAGLPKVLSNKEFYHLGFSQNFEANIFYSRKLSIWGNIVRSSYPLHSSVMNPDIGIPFLTSPAEEFKFIGAETNIHSIDLNLGIQYHLFTLNKFKPFIGLGYGMSKEYDYELSYEFVNNNSKQQLNIERFIQHNIAAYKFLNLSLGANYNFNSRLRLQANLFYKRQYGTSHLLISEIIKSELKFMYRI